MSQSVKINNRVYKVTAEVEGAKGGSADKLWMVEGSRGGEAVLFHYPNGAYNMVIGTRTVTRPTVIWS